MSAHIILYRMLTARVLRTTIGGKKWRFIGGRAGRVFDISWVKYIFLSPQLSLKYGIPPPQHSHIIL